MPTLSAPGSFVSENVSEKLLALRALLRAADLDGLLVLSGDEHLNSYLPETRQRRRWLTGFTGSAGDALIAQEQAWLAVDARYHEQAEQQAQGFSLIKLGLRDQPTLQQVVEELGSGFRLGVDPFTISASAYQALARHAEVGGVTLVPTETNWVDRAKVELEGESGDGYADQPVYSLPDSIVGATIAQKLEHVRQSMAQRRVGLLPLTRLDQVAWLFNLRGSDMPYSPVFIAYALVSASEAALFTRLARLDPQARQTLTAAQVGLYEYELYPEMLRHWAGLAAPVGIDPQHTTQGTLQLLAEIPTRELEHPIELLKARKNSVELEHMRRANLQASRAKIRTLAWIDRQWAAGIRLSERDVAERIERHYAEEPNWKGLSFNTIAGSGPNSSIVHYGTPDPERYLEAGQILLLDSGSQYLGGTTDATRTIVLGDPTRLQRTRYTEVLKAHIQCASQRFPVKTPGSLLDGITRSTLWQAGMDFGHGTGHGVGAFLNVHEGPNGISRRATAGLEAGMITSVEPGFYEPGWGGIRIENLCEIEALPDQEGWLQFRPLTWIPFDRQLIDTTLLSWSQRQWLQSYLQEVLDLHSPNLDPKDIEWLKRSCTLENIEP